MICAKWPPNFGGAAQYEYRLAKELIRMGFEVMAFTGTAQKDGFDNGSIPVERFVPHQDLDIASWKKVLSTGDQAASRNLFDSYRFFDSAIKWAYDKSVDIVLIGITLQITQAFHARELYSSLKAMQIKVGCIHHDLAHSIIQTLAKDYLKEKKGWEISAKNLEKKLIQFFKNNHEIKSYFDIGSPLFFSPDFVISCSSWSARFIDPLEKTPKIVVHPILDADYWGEKTEFKTEFDYRDILMINPQSRKNPRCMAGLINSDHNWTFRVLKGGWGDGFKDFKPLIRQSLLTDKKRIELLDYVLDIRSVYQSSGLVFFPSFTEGYGMTAVEPMYAGVPVVSSNYPAIIEAVGNASYTCCPYTDNLEVWCKATEEVLQNRVIWSKKSLSRVRELNERQVEEMGNLTSFLISLVN